MAEFELKKIFLADDDRDYRSIVREYLEMAGHVVIVEVESGKKALEIINNRQDLDVDAGVLDCRMPYPSDGPRVAEALTRRFPKILIASISAGWRGRWPDPNYDKNNLHPANINQLDINGRGPLMGPHLDVNEIDGGTSALVQAIGEWRFSLVDQGGLETIAQAKFSFRDFRKNG